MAAEYCFDLASELPLRGWLFRLGEAEHVLVLVVHHIAADGWSLAPLARDLEVAYAARCRGEAPGWVALAVQYADYTLWQQVVLGDETDPHSAMARQLAYWQPGAGGTAGAVGAADRSAATRGGELPRRQRAATDRGGAAPEAAGPGTGEPGEPVHGAAGGPGGAAEPVGCGEDIAIGSPIAGRTDDALDDLVGFFVNTLVLRTDTSGNPSFSELLARVRESDLAAYAHQDLPFERLVEELNPARSLARHPLFQVMLVLQNQARRSFALPGVVSTPEAIGTQTAKFDLSVNLSERRGADGVADGLVGRLDYAADLFDRATVEALGARLVRLFEAIASDPLRPVGGIDILAPAERAQLLEEWNDTAHAVPAATLPELFEAQVARTPDAVALVFEDTALSYAELNTRANRLAHLLIGEGVGPESIVALALPRSLEMVVGLLGILKAGACLPAA